MGRPGGRALLLGVGQVHPAGGSHLRGGLHVEQGGCQPGGWPRPREPTELSGVVSHEGAPLGAGDQGGGGPSPWQPGGLGVGRCEGGC